MQDKALSVLGANLYAVQKKTDEQLKKRQDMQAKLKSDLGALTKKNQGSDLKNRDLGDAVYEKITDIGKEKFLQSHSPNEANYSELMTTVLIVVPKKREVQFKNEYVYYLINHNKNDFANWKKRKEMELTKNYQTSDQHEGISDEEL